MLPWVSRYSFSVKIQGMHQHFFLRFIEKTVLGFLEGGR